MNARNAQLVYENTLIKDQITQLMKEREMRVGFKLQRSLSKNQILLMY
jgi:membrane peptidoglycan carboxypeptidase